LTPWQALIERANLKKGQKVLIHAGSGGVGTFAIQLAKHLGATVATTTSAANLDLVKSLAADGGVFYTVPENHFNCAVGAYTHNIALSPERENETEQTLKRDRRERNGIIRADPMERGPGLQCCRS
jgi:NADPH:quinone reductase-like Zn-dependent oxidoreductase